MKNKTVKRVKGWAITNVDGEIETENDGNEQLIIMATRKAAYAYALRTDIIIPVVVSYQIKAPRGKRTK